MTKHNNSNIKIVAMDNQIAINISQNEELSSIPDVASSILKCSSVTLTLSMRLYTGNFTRQLWSRSDVKFLIFVAGCSYKFWFNTSSSFNQTFGNNLNPSG